MGLEFRECAVQPAGGRNPLKHFPEKRDRFNVRPNPGFFKQLQLRNLRLSVVFHGLWSESWIPVLSSVMLKITYYLDVVSSWCFYVEPLWKELKTTYVGEISFDWKISLIPTAGLPGSREEEEWYYRRSGLITKQATMLNAAWVDTSVTEYLAPNLVAQAAKDLGENGDAVRMALTQAALVKGKQISQIDVCVQVAAQACNCAASDLKQQALLAETEAKIRASTAEFHRVGINQRPAFFLESEIEDRAIFSGLIHRAPLVSTIEAMIEDVKAYRAWAAHMGPGWKSRTRI